MMMKTIRSTTPAVIVRPNDWKIAPIVFTSWLGNGLSKKSLARQRTSASTASGENPRGRRGEHQHLRSRERRLEPLAAPQEARDGAQQARNRDEREERDAGVIQVIGIAREPDPAPAARRAGPLQELLHRPRPHARQAFQRHPGRERARQLEEEGDHRHREGELRPVIEPARVNLLRVVVRRRPHGQTPRPRSSARTPAISMTTMTMRRTTAAGVMRRSRAPRREPSEIPSSDGTATSGITAPRLM